MPLKPAAIVISVAVYQILSKFARSRTLPARQVERAKIFLLCADGLNNLQISEKVSIGQDSVSKWRTRFFKQPAPPAGGGAKRPYEARSRSDCTSFRLCPSRAATCLYR